MRNFYVLKMTDTATDPLLAFGLAELIRMVVPHETMTTIMEEHPHYKIDVDPPLEEKIFEDIGYTELLYQLASSPQEAENLGEKYNFIFDLEKERKRRDEYNKAWQDMAKKFRKDGKKIPQDIRSQIETQRPDIRLPLFSVLSSLKADSGYRKVLDFQELFRDDFSWLVKTILEWFSQPRTDFSELAKEIKGRLKKNGREINLNQTALQLLNPAQGKGINQPKASGTSPGNIGSYVFLEWLKFIGYFVGGVAQQIQTGPRSWDKKIFVLLPRHLAINTHNVIFNEFRQTLYGGTSIKFDILTVLNYTKKLLNYWETETEADKNDVVIDFIRRPCDYVTGFTSVYYKNLGQADAVSNITTLALPEWLRVKNTQECRKWQDILDEHIALIRGIPEEGKEFYALGSYRDFISSSRIISLLDFLGEYAVATMREMPKDRSHRRFYPQRLGEENLKEVLIMVENGYKKILETPGFVNLAKAIRQSTVSLQAAPKTNRPYDVKYGLVQEMKRKTLDRNSLIKFLSDFIATYNAENARKVEVARDRGQKLPWYRSNISTEDLEQVIALMDEFEDAELIGKMLMAYGFARSRRDASAEEETATN